MAPATAARMLQLGVGSPLNRHHPPEMAQGLGQLASGQAEAGDTVRGRSRRHPSRATAAAIAARGSRV